jgi:hypothetical protein
VYFLGTMANVRYRKLRHLRRPDAATIVRKELESDVSLNRLLILADQATSQTASADILDDVLGDDVLPGPLTPLLSLLATKTPEESISLENGDEVDVKDILGSLQSAITAAAEDAEEDERDQAAQTTPLVRADKAIAELTRALSSLPRARAFNNFDETAMSSRIEQLRKLVNGYPGAPS